MAFTAWTAGTRITAAKLAAMTPIYTAWTPTWTTAAGTPPSFGDATVTCRYAQSGDLVVASFSVLFGSTTVFGSGGNNWSFGLPVTAAATGPAAGFLQLNTGVTTETVGLAIIATTSTIQIEVISGRVDGAAVTSSGRVDNAAPETWVAGDSISGTFTYEAA